MSDGVKRKHWWHKNLLHGRFRPHRTQSTNAADRSNGVVGSDDSSIAGSDTDSRVSMTLSPDAARSLLGANPYCTVPKQTLLRRLPPLWLAFDADLSKQEGRSPIRSLLVAILPDTMLSRHGGSGPSKPACLPSMTWQRGLLRHFYAVIDLYALKLNDFLDNNCPYPLSVAALMCLVRLGIHDATRRAIEGGTPFLGNSSL
ncbi:hypothetical protein D918_00161 [Trichuris suis]|nr:hypothetical protein D918_00161 [Trichuris suis]